MENRAAVSCWARYSNWMCLQRSLLWGLCECIISSFPPNFMKTAILQTQEVQ